MFKHFFLFLCFLLLTVTADAVPARPGVRRNLTLSDGTTVNALLVGDEYAHYWLADDGTGYVSNGDTYERIDVEKIQKRAQERRSAENTRRSTRLARSETSTLGTVGTYLGSKKGIILLVAFSDFDFQEGHDKELYDKIANEKGYKEGKFRGSVHDYFYDQSEGQFDLTFDVVGPFKVSKERFYYGENYERPGYDKHAASLLIEVLRMADDQVDYSDYDWDGDGEVDQVFMIYAGDNEAEGGDAKTIWPHEFLLSEALYQFGDGEGAVTLDNVKIDNYACGSEVDRSGNLAGIGVICHEFSHCLGYPDFYNLSYSGGTGMDVWDLMDEGSYNEDGFLPAGFTSYERWMAGWKDPIELTETTVVDSMKALQDGGDTYVIYNKGHKDEYYLLENRQKVGWDEGIPGEGLLILHVDYDATEWFYNEVNGDPEHQRMTWVAADNEYQSEITSDSVINITFDGMAHDPFPFDSINAFNRNTTPAATLFNMNQDGTYFLDGSIEDITQNPDRTVSFRFITPYNGSSTVETGVSVKRMREQADVLYDLTGRRVYGTPSPGVYIKNGRKTVIK